jgi:RNA polymerase sigma-70 factor (ECF subfamily)
MNQAITDEEAIGRVRDGDITSYGVLATRYHQRLCRVALRVLRNEADAEDAVQGAHLLALTHFDQYAGRSGYFGWMSAITVNQALTQKRRSKGGMAAGEDEIDTLPSPLEDPERQVMEEDLNGHVRVALASLPPAYRAVFQLRDLESMSTAETGERLGLTKACVKTRLVRARSLLRRRLTQTLKSADPFRCARTYGTSVPVPELAGRVN